MKDTRDLVPAELQRYVGRRPYLEDQHARATLMAFTLINECLAAPGTPFDRLSRNGLLLCEATRVFLYDGTFGVLDGPYQRGTRPLLEQWVARYVQAGMSEAEKAIALSQSLRYDLPASYPPVPVFLYGESDEQTMLKGGGHCSCRARLLAALCQVAGLEARPAMFWTWSTGDLRKGEAGKVLGGHTVTEVRIDGRWGFFDPELHFYCRSADGGFPSIAAIRENPVLLTGMDAALVESMRPYHHPTFPDGRFSLDYYAYKYLDQRCPTQISQHDVREPYTGRWTWATDDLRQRQKHDYQRYRNVLNELADRGELTDAIYALDVRAFREAMDLSDAKMALPA